jgi:IS5 family transposase
MKSTASADLPGFSSVTEALPDETPLLNFRHWLDKHTLTDTLLSPVNSPLKEPGWLVSKGASA